MTQEQVDEQMDKTSEMMNNPMFIYLFPSIGIVVMSFIWFFVFATIGFLIAKFALKGDGGFTAGNECDGIAVIHFCSSKYRFDYYWIAYGKNDNWVKSCFFNGNGCENFTWIFVKQVRCFCQSGFMLLLELLLQKCLNLIILRNMLSLQLEYGLCLCL